MSDVLTPIDHYLAEQQAATAVETFARRHDAGLVGTGSELDADDRWYSERLPTSRPEAGQQYGFRVDLDSCSGCKSCVAACHSLNGLDEGESWRTVGLLVGTDPGRPGLQTVPSGCHHCVDPACLSGCPTNAYEKDPWTGIVRHLDDQCFGCGYCELTCPYEVPKLNHRLGIVRKCDMCADSLAEGEAPACVQACPTGAIAIDVVDLADIEAECATGSLVPGAPASSITRPTTRYVGTRVPQGAQAADHHALHPSKAHPPLAFMLVLVQLSLGALVTSLLARFAGAATEGGPAVAAGIGVVALGGSLVHLGRPLVAWRAVLGIGHSWLSREIVALGSFAALSIAHVAVDETGIGPDPLAPTLGLAAVVAGIAGLVSSALLYVVTRRTWWALRYTLPKFVGTAVAAGGLAFSASVTAVAAATGSVVSDAAAPAAAVAAVTLALKLLAEASVLRRSVDPVAPTAALFGAIVDPVAADLDRTARLLRVSLATSTRWRLGLGVVGVVGAAAVALVTLGSGGAGAAVLSIGVLLLLVAGELVERYQFFTASVAPRMPGGFRR